MLHSRSSNRREGEGGERGGGDSWARTCDQGMPFCGRVALNTAATSKMLDWCAYFILRCIIRHLTCIIDNHHSIVQLFARTRILQAECKGLPRRCRCTLQSRLRKEGLCGTFETKTLARPVQNHHHCVAMEHALADAGRCVPSRLRSTGRWSTLPVHASRCGSLLRSYLLTRGLY